MPKVIGLGIPVFGAGVNWVTFLSSKTAGLNSVKDKVNIKAEDIISDENNNFKVYCKIPNILTEFNLENEFRKNSLWKQDC